MTEKQVLREAMKVKNMSQMQLAQKAGYKYQSHVGNILQRTGMRVENLVKLLNAMDCELVVRSKGDIEMLGSGGRTYRPEWVIDESESAE